MKAVLLLTAPCLGAIVCAAADPAAQAPIPAKIEFNRDVRPILSDNCFKCHGFDKKHREANRRLDTREGALEQIDGVMAVVPRDLAKSELSLRTHSKDKDEVMPPPDSGKKLNARQIAILDAWIQQGAEYQDHWAYIKPLKTPLPTGPGKNSIDLIVGARLAQQGLQPSPEADRRTLIRRLSLDLIGLPPTPEDADNFVADTSAGAYEKLVDKLLASPHYGEQMAMPWLDVVRFADTIGYHSDNPRDIWPYRDYVINSFNANKPFDQFSIEQIAGDLLPGSTQQQKVASAYNRLILSTEEGGAQSKDYQARMLTDRVRAIGTVWLGQTIACAQCHDHKFDPISTKDFYSLGAFFADIEEPIVGKRGPGMQIPDAADQAKIKEFEAQIAAIEKQIDSPETKAAAAATETALKAEALTQGNWTALHPAEAKSDSKAKLSVGKDETISVSGGSDKEEIYHVTLKTSLPAINGFRIEALTNATLPDSGPGLAAGGEFILTELSIARDAPGAQSAPVKVSQAQSPATRAGLTPAAAIDGNTDSTNGWSVTGGGDTALYLTLPEPLTANAEQTLIFTLRHAAGKKRALGKFRISATADNVKAPKTYLEPELFEALKAEPARRSPAQQTLLTEYSHKTNPKVIALRAEKSKVSAELERYKNEIPRCLVTNSMKTPREVRILPRGDFMNDSGEVVLPALPHYLPQPANTDGRRLTRLDLAQWLVSKDNPLTARVFVNRLWKQYFGIGLSKVLDDLGTQGEEPRNAALLDWLAAEFMESGWDLKHMVKLMVTSQTYRQVSTTSKALEQRDPLNRETARQSRWRLDAELVRDSALQAAGLLSGKIGGDSAKPYQPDGYWENLNFPVRTYQADKQENQYRRGLYTWWQRSALHPSILAFDAPSREECTAERARSNIPQQALALLNDPTYVEAARVFAARILTSQKGATPERLTWALRQALSRAASPQEIQTLTELLQSNLTIYQGDLASAQKLLAVGQTPAPASIDPAELAAWTQVARVILNLHETITRS